MPTRASSLQNSTLTGLTREVGSKYDEIKIVADNMSVVQELAGTLQSGVDLGEIVNVVGDVAALELAMDGKVDKVVGSSLMTDVEHAKLADVAAGATVNKTDAYLLDRVNHTGVQSLDTTIDATDRLAMTAAERLKLSTVESRANHTGTQSADTLTDGVANVAMTVGERRRLAAMEDGANNYVHPASHPVSILDGGTNYNKVVKTDALGHVGFGDVSWTDVAGKPSTYTPSAHEHSLDEVTSGTISATRVVPTEIRQFVSASQLANIADMELKTNRGIPNGYAPLNANGKINASYIADLNLMDVFTPNDLNSMLNLTSAQPGDIAYRLDTGNSYMLIALPSSLEANWKQLNAGAGVVSINGLDGIVALGSANVPESGTNYYFTNERVDDRVVGLLQAGNNISLNYDYAANTLTVSANDISVDWSEIQNKPDPVVTVTLQGDVTGTANATMTDMGNATVTVTTTVANDSHTHTFSNLTSKPTTVSGYGITDAYTKTEADSALSLKAPLTSPTFTGTVALPSTTSIGNVSSTELGYLDGVTSSIQTQFNGKVSKTGDESISGVKTFNSNTIFNGNVGIGTNYPNCTLALNGIGVTGGQIQFQKSGALQGNIYGTGSALRIENTSLTPIIFIQNTGFEYMRIDTSGNVLVTGSGGLGYGTGSGGTVTQLTSKSTTVTLNKPSGQIQMNNATLASNTAVEFLLTNSLITANDNVYITFSGSQSNNYSYKAKAVAGGVYIIIKNESTGSLSEVVQLNFTVIKGAVA